MIFHRCLHDPNFWRSYSNFSSSISGSKWSLNKSFCLTFCFLEWELIQIPVKWTRVNCALVASSNPTICVKVFIVIYLYPHATIACCLVTWVKTVWLLVLCVQQFACNTWLTNTQSLAIISQMLPSVVKVVKLVFNKVLHYIISDHPEFLLFKIHKIINPKTLKRW